MNKNGVARQCIEAMKENGTLRNHMIGVVTHSFPGEFPTYHKGERVIFRDDGDNTVTVEKPMTMESINENRAKGSLNTTIGTMVNVPKRLIKGG